MPDVMDLFRLDGRSALVTGGSRGLGRVMAEALAEAGASVCITSRSLPAAHAAAAEVSSADLVSRLVARAAEQFGPVDILVNNAGVNIRGSAGDLAESDWDAVLATNLKGVFLVSRALGPGMCARGWGRV